eukprot:7649065-Alexandrium_andersonii.AAC.1
MSASLVGSEMCIRDSFSPQPAEDHIPEEGQIYVTEEIAFEGYGISPTMHEAGQAQHPVVDQRGRAATVCASYGTAHRANAW